MAKYQMPDSAREALRMVEKSQQFHDQAATDYRKRFDAFLGHLDDVSDAAQWQSRLHPPYLNHIVETSVSGLLDDRFMFRVKPRPRFFDPGEFQAAQAGAKAHEILFRQQLCHDRFNEFQRPFALIAAVNGWAFGKTYWKNEVAPKKRLTVVDAAPPELQALGHSVPQLKEVDRVETVFDGPVTEAVDPRDIYWHEAAVSLEKARWVAHAIWMSVPDIEAQTKGPSPKFDPEAVKALSDGSDEISGTEDIERERERRGRKKDMVEVLEIWDREKKTVTTLAGRKVLLRQRDWPFWHGQYPFVVSSLQPFPFSLQGTSMVEKLMHLQTATWDMMNQRIDNVRFLNNAIQIVRSDVDDPDNLYYEPGAQWFLEDPAAVQMWHPDPAAAQISMPAEAGLKQDMQNLAGGHPFTTTGEASSIGADTATEAALVTNLAQKSVASMKTQLYYGYERIGQQRMELNQQFIRESVWVNDIGLDGADEVKEIVPFLLQGDYQFDITPMSESLMRSERRAEAQGLFQVAAQSAPVMAAVGSPWNMRAFGEKLLEAFDLDDEKDRYFSAVPQSPPAQSGQPQAPGGSGGVTAPQSVAANTSPSNQASISPEVFMQRAGASQGGAANS